MQISTFTQDDLLQYLYKDCSPEKTVAIEAALSSDWSLREAMDLLKASHQQLNEVKSTSPRQQTLDNIFSYAEKTIEALHA